MSETAHTPSMAAIARYVEMRARQPLVGLGDAVHAIHAGSDYEAELKLSDLAQVIKDHADMLDALIELNCVIGLTAIKYPEHLAILQKSVDRANSVIAKAEGRS